MPKLVGNDIKMFVSAMYIPSKKLGMFEDHLEYRQERIFLDK